MEQDGGWYPEGIYDDDDDDDDDDEDVVVFVEGHHGGQGSRKTIIEELPDEFLHSLMVKF